MTGPTPAQTLLQGMYVVQALMAAWHGAPSPGEREHLESTVADYIGGAEQRDGVTLWEDPREPMHIRAYWTSGNPFTTPPSYSVVDAGGKSRAKDFASPGTASEWIEANGFRLEGS